MSDLPLNAMENNQDNLANAMDNNSNFSECHFFVFFFVVFESF